MKDAHIGHIGGAGDGRGPGILEIDPDYRTVLVDKLGAVATLLQPAQELAIYLELGGRLNQRAERDEAGYLFSPGQAAELVAAITAAAEVAPDEFRREFVAALERERTRRSEGRE